MNTLNNKTKQSWLTRLFNISGKPNKAPSGKIYFAHRYSPSRKTADANPFHSLFTALSLNRAVPPDEAKQLYKIIEDDLFEYTAPLQAPALNSLINSPVNQSMNSRSNADFNESLFTVLNIYSETNDTKTFRLADVSGRVLAYLPGQYMTLTLLIAGKRYKRSYSLASSPSRPGIYEITVKRLRGGIVSNWLNDNLKVGDRLSLKGPFGKFSCAHDELPKKILFLAAGSGIVPIMSMLRWLADTEAPVEVVLLLSFRTVQDIIYHDELKMIASRHRHFQLHITLTQEVSAHEHPYHLGRINQDTLITLMPGIAEKMVYLCGPDGFIEACKSHLRALKVPEERINCESFHVGSSLIADGNPYNNRLGKQPSSYQITFNKSGITVPANGQMNLLAVAEQAGVAIKHECLNGECGECMIKCLSGKVEMTPNAEIDNYNRKKGWVYACCAYPASNAVVEA